MVREAKIQIVELSTNNKKVAFLGLKNGERIVNVQFTGLTGKYVIEEVTESGTLKEITQGQADERGNTVVSLNYLVTEFIIIRTPKSEAVKIEVLTIK